MTKIMQIVGDGNPSGGTTVVLALVKDFIKRNGWEVSFVSQKKSYALQMAAQYGANTYGVDFFKSRFNPKAVSSLKKILAEEKPDIVHVHAARAGFPFSYAIKKFGIPWVYTVHSYHFLGKGFLGKYLGAWAERRCHKYADATTFVCEYDRQIAKKWHLHKNIEQTNLIYNGIDTKDFPAPKPTDTTKVVFLGNLLRQKNPEKAIEIAEEMRKDNVHFYMIGGGELEQEIKKRISQKGLVKKVDLPGRLSRFDALKELNGAAVMLLPSRWEGLPVAPIEASYMGIPSVVSDKGGLPEVIEDGVNGIVVSSGEAKDYADAIRKITRDNDYRQKLGENGKKRVENKFLRSVVHNQYKNLYESLV